jgi:dihydroneopterin aldolase
MDLLLIKQLSLETSIGVFAWEKQIKRKILLDIEIAYDSTLAAASDELKDALDYDGLYEMLKALAAEKHYQLIETLANTLADALFEKVGRGIKLTLYKPRALRAAEAVGLTVMRS